MNFTRMLLLFSICFVILPITSEAVTFTVNSKIDDVDIVPAEERLRKAWEELYSLREKVSIFQDCVTFQIREGGDLDG